MPQYQRTLKKTVELFGKEPLGGNYVKVEVSPASTNKGIWLIAEGGRVKACLANAKASHCSTKIKNNEVSVLNSEHLLATLRAYGISNAFISISTENSRSRKFFRSLGIEKNTFIIPYFAPELEKEVCEEIEGVGLTEQNAKRKTYRLDRKIETPEKTPKLTFEPIEGSDLVFKVITDYPVIGEQEASITITPESYKTIANARSYNKHLKGEKVFKRGPGKTIPRLLASFLPVDTYGNVLAKYLCYPWFGLDHGFSRETNFLAPGTREEWKKQERMPAEIACHSVIDGLGAVSLLEYDLIGTKITCHFGGHSDYIRFLQANLDKFVEKE